MNSKALAACVLKAENISPGLEASNDKYWHTREACGALAKKEKCVGRMVKLIQCLEFQLSSNLDELAAPFWAQVAHPDVLIEEVHET